MNPSKADKTNCPYICPTTPKDGENREFLEAGQSRSSENPYAVPYVPGCITPREKKVYPPGAPPTYLPQPTDSTSGDILGMGPIGPWAAGHVDWTPQAGMTGVRPVVDKYSITRYSTGEWRKNNQKILSALPTNKGKEMEIRIKKEIEDAFQNLDNKASDSNRKLNSRVKDLSQWKKKVEKALQAMDDEIYNLTTDITKLKNASKILMMPEAISRECLDLRSNRYEPDLVRDDAEQELIKEMAIAGEIRRVFQNQLAKAEMQMANNRAAKSALESDWSDKMVSLKLDKRNMDMTPDSTLILWHPGAARWTDNSTSLEYWEHYCAESIKNCDEVRQKSEKLRADLTKCIINGSQDMKLQAERTDQAMVEKVIATEGCCADLEAKLKDNLQKIANIENLIDYLKERLRRIDERNKLVMTRLHARNYDRPNVESCRDEAQYALMAEAKFIKETTEAFVNKVREAEAIRSELMTFRGDLEKDIACKRKSLNIDEDRCARVRSFMPTPEEFANA